jgi:hypothetical protein
VLGAGYSVYRTPAGSAATGPAIFFTIRENHVLLVESLERTFGSGSAGGSTLGLVGGGVVQRWVNRWNMSFLGVAGFDSPDHAGVMPVGGLRWGLEWLGARSSFNMTLNALTDLSRGTMPDGRSYGGFMVGLTMSVGLSVEAANLPGGP